MTLFVKGYLRSLRSALPFGKTDSESVNFARFHDEPSTPTGDSTELKNIQNGGVAAKQSGYKTTSNGDCSQDGAGYGNLQQDYTEDVNAQDKITEWQAGWNVTNAIQGMFIVTFPYAVLEGGYWVIFTMIFVAYICCYTGKILVDCLYDEDPDGNSVRIRDSYVAIAEEVWGARIGAKVVNTAQIIELLMTCILYVLLCGDLMIGSFPDTPVDLSSWIMISSMLLLPCAFLRSLRHVSWLSFWCTVAHMFINAIILIYCLTRVQTWHWSEVNIQIDIWTFPISLGIVIFSYTSQIFLPTLEGNMVDRGKFHCMMHWTHIAAAIFKALFSYVGFLTWGMQTKEVITNNLPNYSMKLIVNLFLVAKALLSYPLPYFAAAGLIEATFFQGKPLTVFPSCFDAGGRLKMWGLILRLGLVVFTLLMAIFIPHFAILMGLIGSFTGNMLSLVWPCYFHLKIKGHTMAWWQKFIDIFIILFGLLCSIIGIYFSSRALVRAFQGYEPRPFQGH